MTEIDAAIVIVTYNHAAYIADCLRSIAALDPAPREIVVVDNASRDGTAALIKAQFPDIRLIEAGANLGFSGGCNLGVRTTSAATVVLTNPDLIAQPDWLAQLCAPLERWPDIGIVGCKLLYRDGTTFQHAGGLLHLPLALGHHRGVGETDRGQYDALEVVDYVTGAALACPRKLWEELGGLDEQFFPAYYEEVDFCTRTRQAGYRIVYTPQAVATHIEGSSVGHGSARYLRLFHFNRLRYLFKHFNNTWLMRTWLPAELAHIRAVANNHEIEALQMVYLAFQSAFCSHESRPVISDLDVFPDATADGGETELQWVERQLLAKASVVAKPLHSRWPLVAFLRNTLLRLATADYIQPLVQAQNDANQAMAEAVQALARQRRAADAAVLLQGMILAKINNQD
ncbi:MAG: glycosyltransferase family 2 protein [Herpetosiphonaceae bacterium]|nr:glycosyltransferase family 2 protein [Herpetosiphonaceae bacterium]